MAIRPYNPITDGDIISGQNDSTNTATLNTPNIRPYDPATDGDIIPQGKQPQPSALGGYLKKTMDALSAIKGAPLTVPGYLLGKVGDVAQAVLPDSIGQPISTALHAPLVAGHALEGYGAQSPESQQESQNWLNQVTNETGGGKLAAGLTGLAHGYFNNYLPQTQVQPGTTESMIQGVGNLAGMAANMGGGLATKATTKAIEALAPGLIGKLLPMGVQMGAYGAQTQAPNLTAHMANTAEQAAMSVPFSLGGMLAGGAIKALAPNAPEWLAHLINSGALGAGAGAFQPAQDWQERLKNMGMGAGEFAIAHAINPFNYTSEPLKTGGELYSNNSDMYRIVYPKDNDINNIGAKNEPTTPLEQTTEPQTQPTVSAIEPTEPITEPAGIDLTKLSPKDKELIDKVNAGVYTLDDLTNFQAKRFEKHGIIDKDRNLTEAGATIIKPKPVEAESQPPTPPVEDATTMQTPDTIKDMSDTTKADVGDSTQPDAISPIKKNLTTEKPVAQPESYLDTNPNISQEPEVANKKGNETEGLTKSPNLDVSQSSDADANEPADHLVDANKMVGAQEAAKTAAMSINSQQLRDRLALATENDLPRLEDAKVNIKSHIKNAPNSFVKNRLAAHLNAVNDAMTRIKDIQEFKKDRPILDTMYEQIDMAQAGQRYSIDNPNSMHGDWTGTKSTFPDWAYEGITKKRFFDLYNRATGQDEKGSPLTENMKAELHGLLRYAKEQIERHQGGYVNDTGSMHEQRLEHQKEQLEQQAIESEANRETEKKVDISTLPVEEGDKVKMINKYGNPDTFTYKGVNEKGNMEFQDHYTEEVPLFGEPVKREVLGIEKKPTKDVGFELTAPEPKAAKGKKPVTPDMFGHANAMEGGISGGQEKLTPLETAQRDAEEARAKADEAARQGELPGTTVQEHREKALRVRDNDGNIHTIYEPGAVDHAKVAEIYNVNPQNIVDAGWRLKDGSFQADPKSVLMMMKSWKTNSNRNPDYSVGKQGEGEKAFVKASDGTTDFGEVVEGKKVIPVRLQVGNKLYGKTKIKNKHEKKIQSAGYPDVESFIEDVAKKYTEIWEQPDGRIMLVKRNGGSKIAVVELRKKEGELFYGVTTAFVPDSADYPSKGGRKLRPGGVRNPSANPEQSTPLIYPAPREAQVEGAWRSGSVASNSTIPHPAEPVKPENEGKFFDRVKQGGVTATDILSHVSKDDSSQGEIAKALLGNKDLKNALDAIKTNISTTGTFYRSSTNTISLFEGHSDIERLHEVIHALTSRYLSEHDMRNPIHEIRNEVFNRLPDRDKAMVKRIVQHIDGDWRRIDLPDNDIKRLYPFIDAHEFLAEAFTNSRFQNYLKRIPIEGEVKDQQTTLWDKFVDVVKKALGLNNIQRTMLDKVLEEGARIMQKQADMTRQGNVGYSVGKQEAPTVKLTDDEILKTLKDNTVPFRKLELTPETWGKEFGENRTVKTPEGDVIIGMNQFLKLATKDKGNRGKYFGLIKPTLAEPLYIVEAKAPKEGAERDTKKIFINSFRNEDGNTYFMSVTIQQGGKEISISSHPKDANDLKGIIKRGEVLYPKSAPVLQPAASRPQEHPTSAGGHLDNSTLPHPDNPVKPENEPAPLDQTKKDITAEQKRILGDNTKTEFVEGDVRKAHTPEEDEAALSKHGLTPDTVGDAIAEGSHKFDKDNLVHSIKLSLMSPEEMRDTSLHEIGHGIQKTLDAMGRKTDKAILENAFKKEAKENGEAVSETIADKFRDYVLGKEAEQRSNAEPKGLVRRIFDRIIEFGEKLKNYLNDRGFKSVNDIFGEAYRGELAGKVAERGSKDVNYSMKKEDLESKLDVKVARLDDRMFSPALWKARIDAKKWAKENIQGKSPINKDTGWKIDITGNGIDKALSGERQAPIDHIEAVRAIPELIENSVLAETRPDRNNDPHIKNIHIFYAPLEMGGKLYRAKLTIKERNDGKRFYDHSLIEMEKPAAGTDLRAEDTFTGSASRPMQQARSISVKDLLKDVKTSDGKNIGEQTGAEPGVDYSIKKDEAAKEEQPKTKWQQLREKNKAINAVSEAVKTRKDEIKSILTPMSMGEAAKTTGGIVRENVAEMVRKYDVAEKSMKTARDFFDKEGKGMNVDFMDNIETGNGQVDSRMQRFADDLRKAFNDRVEQVRALGTGKLKQVVENYFPHIWKDPEAAKNFVAEFYAKRPLAGSGAFLKKRSIPTVKDGLAAGLELAFDNPVEIALHKMREMDKYIMAHKSLNEMKVKGLAKYVKIGGDAPDGWQKIDDKIATVFGAPEIKVADLTPAEREEAEQMAKMYQLTRAHERQGAAQSLWIKKAPGAIDAPPSQESSISSVRNDAGLPSLDSTIPNSDEPVKSLDQTKKGITDEQKRILGDNTKTEFVEGDVRKAHTPEEDEAALSKHGLTPDTVGEAVAVGSHKFDKDNLVHSIKLSLMSPEEMRDTSLHEIGHGIQKTLDAMGRSKDMEILKSAHAKEAKANGEAGISSRARTRGKISVD